MVTPNVKMMGKANDAVNFINGLQNSVNSTDSLALSLRHLGSFLILIYTFV